MTAVREHIFLISQTEPAAAEGRKKKNEERARVKYFEMFSFIFLHLAITFAKECWSHGKNSSKFV